MSVLGSLSILDPDFPKVCTYNTGTLYDYLTGDAIKGYDGKWYIRGGLGNFITGCAGRPNTYKSTLMDSLIARVMHIYPGVEALINDTEGIKDVERVITCGGRHDTVLDPARICLISGASCDIQDVLIKVQAIGLYKEKHMDECVIESPFVDPVTGKRIMAWIPTIVFIDSLTELDCCDEREMLNTKEGMNDKKMQTVWMVDGNKKSVLIRHLRKMCERWGLIVICNAQVGVNISMNSYLPPSKELPHMKQMDKIKGVGSKFDALTRNLLVITRCSTLTAKNQDGEETLYGTDAEITPVKELSEVVASLVRGKTNLSGHEIPFVISQSFGLLNDITHYHYLRCNDYFALQGNKSTHACVLTPEIKMTRNTARQILDTTPTVARAMELCAQFCYVKTHWPVAVRFPALSKPVEYLYERLQKPSSRLDEVLASKGVWSYFDDGRPYLSLFDVLELLEK